MSVPASSRASAGQKHSGLGRWTPGSPDRGRQLWIRSTQRTSLGRLSWSSGTYCSPGPDMDGESLRTHYEERFKENFCQVLAVRFEEWASRQGPIEAREPCEKEPFGDETDKKLLKQFFDHCPFCGSPRIRIRYWQSTADTWRHLAGRAGYFVTCRACREHIHFSLTAMS